MSIIPQAGRAALDAVLMNPLTNPYGFLGQQIGSILSGGGKQEAKGAAKKDSSKREAAPAGAGDPSSPDFVPPPPPPEGSFPDSMPPPPPGSAPQGSSVFEGLGGTLADVLRGSVALQEKVSSIPYLQDISKINLEAYAAQSQIAQQAAMEKSRELTARQIELQNLRSWEAITRAEIDKERAMAQALMSTAYIAGTPNANVLSALSGPVTAAIQSFQPGKSVF